MQWNRSKCLVCKQSKHNLFREGIAKVQLGAGRWTGRNTPLKMHFTVNSSKNTAEDIGCIVLCLAAALIS